MVVGDCVVLSVPKPPRKGVHSKQLFYPVYQIGLYVSCLFGKLVKQSVCELLGFHDDRTVDFASLSEIVFGVVVEGK